MQHNTPVATFDRVTRRYGSVVALNGVSFSIRKGEVLALLGPNGAGKTSAVKLLLGLLRATEGQVRVFEDDPGNQRSRWRIGAMLQTSGVPPTLRAREHIELFSSYYPSSRPLAETIVMAGLQGNEDRLYGEMSGGQKQRLMFALAICGRPDLLVLDEPTVGLDPEARRGLWKQIRAVVAAGASVLLTTHYLDEADSLAHRAIVLDRGSIVTEGTPAEIKQCAQAQSLEDAFLSLTREEARQ